MKQILVLLIGEILEDPRVYRISTALADSGARVTVACTNPSERPASEEHKGLIIRRFPHRSEFFIKRLYNWMKSTLHPGVGRAIGRGHEDVPSSKFMAGLRNALLSLNFRHFMKSNMKINRLMVEAFRDGAFDLVHCNDFDTLHAGAELKALGAVKELLYDSHEYWPGIGVHGSATNLMIRNEERRGIGKSDYVVTVNPLIADALKNDYNLPATPAVLMNCPYKNAGNDVSLNLHAPVRVVYQGKLQAFRGLDELVMAFEKIDGATLTFSGFGPLEDSLKLLSESLGLTDKVRFLGRFPGEDAVSILEGHDIGIMPFRDVTLNMRFTSPNKLFDYAMAGLAIAASDLPFLRQTVSTHEIGMMIDEATPDGIAATLNSMIADRDALLKFKARSRKAAHAEYTWEQQFGKYPWTLS